MKKILAIVVSLSLIWTGFADAKGGGGGGRGGGGHSSGGRGAGGKSYSGGSSNKSSGKSYSGGSSSKSTGKSYSGGSSSKSTGKSYSGSTGTTTKSKSTYDSAAVRDHKTVESRTAYKSSFQKGTEPKADYKDSKGNSVKIDPKDKKIEGLRNKLDHQKWVNRELREQNFYSAYAARPVTLFPMGYYYHDPYNTLFFLWLWDRSIEDRAMWMYCHRDSMDSTRYRDLVAKDAQLEARIKQLEAQKTARDPNYTPKGIDTDLMYTDSYVDSVYNPTGSVNASSGGSSAFGWVCGIFVALLVIGLLVYFVFYYRGF